MEMLPVEERIKLEQNQPYCFDNIGNYGTQRTRVEGYQKNKLGGNGCSGVSD